MRPISGVASILLAVFALYLPADAQTTCLGLNCEYDSADDQFMQETYDQMVGLNAAMYSYTYQQMNPGETGEACVMKCKQEYDARRDVCDQIYPWFSTPGHIRGECYAQAEAKHRACLVPYANCME